MALNRNTLNSKKEENMWKKRYTFRHNIGEYTIVVIQEALQLKDLSDYIIMIRNPAR